MPNIQKGAEKAMFRPDMVFKVLIYRFDTVLTYNAEAFYYSITGLIV